MIPEAAVDAAARALDPHAMGSGGVLSEKFKAATRAEARRALEAAAPYMLAPVYEEGWLAARDFYCRFEGPAGGLDANPYRVAK